MTDPLTELMTKVGEERGLFLRRGVHGFRDRKAGIDAPPWLFMAKSTGSKPELRPSNGEPGCRISAALAERLCIRTWAEYCSRIPSDRKRKARIRGVAPPTGHGVGRLFELAVSRFLEASFIEIVAPVLRPGSFGIESRGHGHGNVLHRFQQYHHLILRHLLTDEIRTLVREQVDGWTWERVDTLLKRISENTMDGYEVSPDITLFRNPSKELASQEVAARNSNAFVGSVSHLRLLFGVVSAKLTLRSDRAQSVRAEAQYLRAHRRGPMCRCVLVTAEPRPSRIVSVAAGSDIDHVYHAFLHELTDSIRSVDACSGGELDLLEQMIDEGRLRDIADLPFDLAA